MVCLAPLPGRTGNLDGEFVIALQQSQTGSVAGNGCGANFIKAGHEGFRVAGSGRILT
jgi:hypothetical protein